MKALNSGFTLRNLGLALLLASGAALVSLPLADAPLV